MAFKREPSHASALSVDELTSRMVGIGMNFAGERETDAEIVHAYWAAIASLLAKDRRFARLVKLHDGPPIDLFPAGTEFLMQRNGEDERFAGSALRVPRGTLRDRRRDVLEPEVLVQRHAGYRNRVLMGPSFRADVWTVLERMPDLPIAEVARRASCSFATAWQIVQDFRLLREATGAT